MAPQLKFLKCASSFSSKPKQDAAIEFTQHCYQLHRFVSYFIRSTQLGLVKKTWSGLRRKTLPYLYFMVLLTMATIALWIYLVHCLFWRRICLSPSAHRSALPRWRPYICGGRLLRPLLWPVLMFSPQFVWQNSSFIYMLLPGEKVMVQNGNFKTWPKQSAPCIRGHHHQLDDNLVEQLTIDTPKSPIFMKLSSDHLWHKI